MVRSLLLLLLLGGCATPQPTVVEILDPPFASTTYRMGDIEAQTQVMRYNIAVNTQDDG